MTTAMRSLIVGNWKMNGLSGALAEAASIDTLAGELPGVEVGLAPPFTLLSPMAAMVHHLSVGGQDCHEASHGAHTGRISAAMLAESGARFVILGHSECRAEGDDDARVRAKVDAALGAGLSVILCVGETARQREAGEAKSAVVGQLAAALPQGEGSAERLTIAYEPVWAIGAGQTPAQDEVEAMHRAIRSSLVAHYGEAGRLVRILYGGSVSASNVEALVANAMVNGVLVGGASLTAESFGAILRSIAGSGRAD